MQKLKTNSKGLLCSPAVSLVTVTQLERFDCLLILKELIRKQTYENIIEWVICNASKTKEDSVKLDMKLSNILGPKLDKINIKITQYFTSSTLGDFRNRVNRACKGSIIVCMDDDDYYPPSRVRHAVEQLSSSMKSIAGCTKMYMYDYDMKVLVQSKGHGEFHSTNACFAYKKSYLTNHKYDSVNCGEEPSFTNNFKEPMIQLDPKQTIIASAHYYNTFNKRELMTGGFLVPEKCSVTGIYDIPITNLIPEDILEQYNKIFYLKKNNPHDIVYLAGSFTTPAWDPENVNHGTPEYNLVSLTKEHIKRGKKVCVYGNMKECNLNGVSFINWKKFRFAEVYKNIILWQLSGLATFSRFGLNATNILLDLYEAPHLDIANCLYKEKHTINKIIFKTQYRLLEYSSMSQLGLDEKNLSFIYEGINTKYLNEFKNNSLSSLIHRDQYRMCHICNNLVLNELENLLIVFKALIKLEPKIQLHIYYKKDINVASKDTEDKNIQTIFETYKDNIVPHLNQQYSEICEEFMHSTFYFNINYSVSSSDRLYMLDSLYLGCVPLIGSQALFQETPGIRFVFENNMSDEQNNQIAEHLFKLVNNPTEISKLQGHCRNIKIQNLTETVNLWTKELV